MMKKKEWMVHFRGEVYANGPFQATNEAEARKWVREWIKVKRLPTGTQVWVTDCWWRRMKGWWR